MSSLAETGSSSLDVERAFRRRLLAETHQVMHDLIGEFYPDLPDALVEIGQFYIDMFNPGKDGEPLMSREPHRK